MQFYQRNYSTLSEKVTLDDAKEAITINVRRAKGSLRNDTSCTIKNLYNKGGKIQRHIFSGKVLAVYLDENRNAAIQFTNGDTVTFDEVEFDPENVETQNMFA